MSKKILACIDGGKFSNEVCKYGIFIAKKLNLPLVLLNVVENVKNSSKLDLSGNIGLGAKDDLQEDLVDEAMKLSQDKIKRGKNALNECKQIANEQNFTNYEILQLHGELDECLQELSSDLKLAIIGLKGRSSDKIGLHVQSVVRALNMPILLVNDEFKPINSVLMAYDGSNFAKIAFEVATKDAVLPDTKRYIVNVNSNNAQSLLNEASEILKNSNFEVSVHALNGDRIEQILNFQKEHNIDIIAMGAYGQNRLKSILFGSFTTKMLLSATKPLLFFR